MGTTAFYEKRLESIVAETEPFFGEVMKVYLDLLCRGEREASRLLFRSGVRFAGAVHGMRRVAASRGCDREGEPGEIAAERVAERADALAACAEIPGAGCARGRSAAAAKLHLERCLYALWTAQQRRTEARGSVAADSEAVTCDGFGAGSGIVTGDAPDTTPLFERGLLLLSALRKVAGQAECPRKDNASKTLS